MKIKQKMKNWYLSYKDAKTTDVYRKEQSLITHSAERLKHVGNFDLTEEQKKAIDDFFLSNYGSKIDYTCHRTYTAFGGAFDVTYMPEELYIPEVERYLNMFGEYNHVLEDKNITPFLASTVGIKTPRKLYSCVKGFLCDSNYNSVTRQQIIDSISSMREVFCKPTVDSGGGFGCMLLKPHGDIDVYSGKKLVDIIDGLGDNYVIQECIHCHESITKIYPKSVNTFRVMTYRWKNEIRLAATIMRIGVGGMMVDNASSGGIFIGIQSDGHLFSSAINKYGDRFLTHPDTGVVFEDCKIEHFEKVLNAAKVSHCAIPQIGIANWDFTLDEEGDAVLIEANLNFGSPWLFQMVNGKSVFGEDTAEILRWTNKVKHTPVSERYKYAFGY